MGYSPHAPTATADFTISGLGEAPVVDLYFFGKTWAVTIAGSSPASFADQRDLHQGNTLYFRQVPVSGGQVAGTFGAGSVVAGFTVLTPEPGPFVMSASPTGNGVQLEPVIEVQLRTMLPRSIRSRSNSFSTGRPFHRPSPNRRRR